MSNIKNISGFPEFLPQEQILFSQIIDIIKDNFELYGFSPMETPVVERVSTLLSKGINDNEIYAISRLAEENQIKKIELALRYDLTVPLARYVSQNYSKLTFPFKRYQISPVWRGERPQEGRYRQFWQCDVDIIAENELSLLNDAEIAHIIYRIFKILDIGKFTILINDRNILVGILEAFGFFEKDISLSIIRIIDKIEKISKDQALSEIESIGADKAQFLELLAFMESKYSNEDWIKAFGSIRQNQNLENGVKALTEVINYLNIMGIDAEYLQINPKIARGMDYYTGTIYETKLNQYPNLGSICSGGRYENLASNFCNKKLPGVGISIGLSRIFIKLLSDGILKNTTSTSASVLVSTQNQNHIKEYLKITSFLRNAGLKTEIYMENKNLASQMKYADKKGFKVVIIANETELEDNLINIRFLKTKEQNIVKIEDSVNIIKKYLEIA